MAANASFICLITLEMECYFRGHMIVDGLRRTPSSKLQEDAFMLAKKLLRTNYQMYQKHGVMYEKYYVHKLDKGAGGEYETPVGFG